MSKPTENKDAGTSKISWTEHTWNPVHGCSKVSPGCKHCYAERISYHKFGHTDHPWTEEHAADNVMEKPNKLDEPYSIDEPSRIFVNSMSDLFHEQISDQYIARVFEVMADLPRHRFQVLTKRPERMAEWNWWPDNVWAGVSVESDAYTDRIDTLTQIDPAVSFVSFEPLLGPIGDVDLSNVDWVIVGGESHKDADARREMDHAWARDLRDKALAANSAFFFKQSSAARTEMGTELKETDGTTTEYQQFPEEVQAFATNPTITDF